MLLSTPFVPRFVTISERDAARIPNSSMVAIELGTWQASRSAAWRVCILLVAALHSGRSRKGEARIRRLHSCSISTNNALGYRTHSYSLCGHGTGGSNRVLVLWIKEWGGEARREVTELWRVAGCGMCGKEHRNCHPVAIKSIEDWDSSVAHGEGAPPSGDALRNETPEYHPRMHYTTPRPCCHNCRLWLLLPSVLLYMYVREYT